ncbi:hypothetical protein GOP47_0012423 [Adiantum capillus-veneris]|uniref:Uncharacterized protein n=1 Tax=Adiantum capillus-veneris TaxID=13818 RepID=A0A9D4UR61_ADICA|nr:hypothetical protein GOP47_0012423 [Adiantum capillus-veneris]
MDNQKLHGRSLFQLGSPIQESPEQRRLYRGEMESNAGFKPEVSPAYMADTRLASRKVNETAERRFQAASWIQSMVGPLHLSAEPSEDEFRLCLRNGIVLCNLINRVRPGSVPKIVDSSVLASSTESAGLSAFQHSQNLRNFLVAVEEMKLPSFDFSDLEKGGLGVGSSTKVVDCVLSVKAYHDWQQRGGQGSRGALKTSCPPKESLTGPQLADTQREWGLDSPKNKVDGSSHLVGIAQSTTMVKSAEDVQKAWAYSDSSVAWVEHICHKFVDTFMAKSRNAIHVSGFVIPEMKLPCQALLKLVMAVLDDKNPEEVAMLVEYMLKKVIAEFSQQAPSSMGQILKEERIHSLGLSKTLQGGLGSFEGLNQNYALRVGAQNKELKELKSALESIRFQFEKAQYGWAEEMKALDGKLHGLVQVATEYHKVAAENRELYNQVQDLRGNIRVYCRVRPFLPGQNGTISTVDAIVDGASIVIVNPARQGKDQRKAFSFNKVFGPSTSQEQVFLDTQPLIRSVLDGYNVCIFAYGQTGSGKTYTMSGPNNPSYKDWGVNFRALHDLFEICDLRKNVMRYEVGVQMIEIYNEQIRNNSQQNGLNVPDAKLLPVISTEDVLELMDMGQRNRAVGATALNDRSSRSHSVLTVHIKGIDLSNGCVLRGCLHLVDLAGSERVDKSEAAGDRLKEAQHINKSLSALGDVIAALAQKSSHIPYRNSKLTQLLQDSLGGQAKTLMFVHISPDCDFYGETISTLKFAERVATVELGAAHTNKESSDVKELKNQIAFLKDALAKKDLEVEFLQEEFRLRGFDVLQDRQGIKAVSSGSTTVTRHGNGNLPMVEMHNLKVHGSPERCVQNVVSPFVTGYARTHEAEEDSLKRRVSEATSPESWCSSGSVVISYPASTARIESKTGSKKNKIRHGSFDELDSNFPGVLYEFDELDEGSEINSSTHSKQTNRKEASNFLLSCIPPMTKSSSTRDLRTLPPATMQPTTRVVAESGENYFTEDDETISDYSEADSWHTATTDHDMSVAIFGKRRKDGDRGFLGHQQSGHLVKKPIGAQGQAMPNSPKRSVVGLSEEAKRRGGKATPEAKSFASKRPV